MSALKVWRVLRAQNGLSVMVPKRGTPEYNEIVDIEAQILNGQLNPADYQYVPIHPKRRTKKEQKRDEVAEKVEEVHEKIVETVCSIDNTKKSAAKLEKLEKLQAQIKKLNLELEDAQKQLEEEKGVGGSVVVDSVEDIRHDDTARVQAELKKEKARIKRLEKKGSQVVTMSPPVKA